MNNDESRELLELAAKAAGIFLTPTTLADVFPKWVWEEGDAPRYSENGGLTGTVVVYNDSGEASGTTREEWNPRDNRLDAFELASRLRMVIDFCIGSVLVKTVEPYWKSFEFDPGNVDDACFAILRAAAEIGRAMP